MILKIKSAFAFRAYPIQPYTPILYTLSVAIDVKTRQFFEFYYSRQSEKDFEFQGPRDNSEETIKPGLGYGSISVLIILVKKWNKI